MKPMLDEDKYYNLISLLVDLFSPEDDKVEAEILAKIEAVVARFVDCKPPKSSARRWRTGSQPP
jgi:hypothetical protein